VTASFKTLCAGTALAALLLAGCPAHQGRPGGPAGQAIPARPGAERPARLGRPYDVIPNESLLAILVYRGGPLAKTGHNHVIASHDLEGTIYVPGDLLRASFEVKVPLAGLTIDEAALRAQEGADFSAAVPDSAREGTRRNMLGEALLNAQMFPEIVLRSDRLEAAGGGAPAAQIVANILAEVRQSPHPIRVPLHYELQPTQLTVSGELPLKQTDLGFTPFSALLGALQVEDEMHVKFRIVARPAPASSDAGR
jgi:polyisoprenoid-binding protein YceI